METDKSSNNQKVTGDSGENLAVKLLEEKGYDVLERNWRFGRLEVDIIAESKHFLMIVEVKTRTSDYMGDPVLAVTKKKQRRLVKAAHAYVIDHDIDKEVRFDIIGIIQNAKKTTINHVEGAFYPLL